MDFFAVLEKRHSRSPRNPLNFQQLSDLLWFAASYREIGVDNLGRSWASRAAPSAGGIHEIEIIIDDDESGPARYDPLHHRLEFLQIDTIDDWQRCKNEIRGVLPQCKATMFMLLGDVEAIAARYENPESLMLRDAGVLTMTLHLTAEALGLHSTPIGFRGEALLSLLGVPASRFVACGVFAVGEP